MTSSCGAGAPAREMSEARLETGKLRLFGYSTLRLLNILAATLREIFDESAYDRFLTRHQLESCPSAYADFLRDHESLGARRARCC